MAKPNATQVEYLEALRAFVIEVMSSFEVWSEQELTPLIDINLGVLKKNATQRHGVTRWKAGVISPSNPSEVETIDLHPRLLCEEWRPYAAWVLHHEFVHALGYTGHDSTFRSLENLWPSTKSATMGKEFTEALRLESAKWLLTCPKCGKEHPRKRAGNGKYMCKKCKKVLVDVPINAAS